ncbi:MAG: NUDIX domain-containing protein [Spirochaetaceae bacterium]|jgi:ADP-ribose pyrophosphatase YjhB (NUDIX family)|nr:NUDIX domain-containing protein [Spirochaetaceae bacterium]
MFRFCPACGSEKIRFEKGKVFRCPCGFVYYHNVASATGCIIDAGGMVVLLIRAKEPALGKLDVPGGFVNPEESALDGLRRECREEIGWDPGTEANFSFLTALPNTYPYKGIEYKTCDFFFTLSAPGLQESDLRLDPEEIGGVRFIRYEDVNLKDLAFDSTRQALRFFLSHKTPDR